MPKNDKEIDYLEKHKNDAIEGINEATKDLIKKKKRG